MLTANRPAAVCTALTCACRPPWYGARLRLSLVEPEETERERRQWGACNALGDQRERGQRTCQRDWVGRKSSVRGVIAGFSCSSKATILLMTSGNAGGNPLPHATATGSSRIAPDTQFRPARRTCRHSNNAHPIRWPAVPMITVIVRRAVEAAVERRVPCGVGQRIGGRRPRYAPRVGGDGVLRAIDDRIRPQKNTAAVGKGGEVTRCRWIGLIKRSVLATTVSIVT